MATLQETQNLQRARIRARDAEIEAFLARLARIITDATRDIVDRVEAVDIETGADALTALGSFEATLIEAGLDSELTRLRSLYAGELEHIQEQFVSLGFDRNEIFTSVDRDIVETLIQQDFRQATKTLRSMGVDIQTAITRQLLTGQPVAIEEGLTGRALNNVRTELDTATAAFSRTVSVKKATDILGANPRFAYVGARIDKVTRDFCRGLLEPSDRQSPVYTLEEINGLDNRQLNPVLQFGGGYNCRHDWVPLTEDAEKDLFG